MFHAAERMNRQTALTASYLNEMVRLKTNPVASKGEVGLSHAEQQELAAENAMYDTQQTNGGAVLDTTARYAQNGLGRVAMMYKIFGLQMYYTQGKLLAQALGAEKDPILRSQARAQLALIQAHVLAIAGVSGLTAYGMLSSVFGMFDDDDELDTDSRWRTAMGETAYKGGINALTQLLGGEGVDVSSRVGLSHLLIGSNRFDFDPSAEKTIVKTLGGPAYGYLSQALFRGVSDIWEGEYQRGIENVLPAAFRNASKATLRYGPEGANTRRGDPIMGEMGAGLLAAQFLGFAPAEYTRNQERNQVLKGIDRAVNEDRSMLTRKLYIAMRQGDTMGMQEQYKKISDFNEKHPNFRLDPKAIKASLKQHMKTSQKMHDGVLFSPKMRATLEQLGRGYDD